MFPPRPHLRCIIWARILGKPRTSQPAEHRDVVNQLDEEMGRIRGFLGDSNRKITGIAVRLAGSADTLLMRPGTNGVVTLGATNAIVHGIDLTTNTTPVGMG